LSELAPLDEASKRGKKTKRRLNFNQWSWADSICPNNK